MDLPITVDETGIFCFVSLMQHSDLSLDYICKRERIFRRLQPVGRSRNNYSLVR